MITQLEHRLAQFVDREDEMRRFSAMLDTGEKPVMVVWGDSGCGKSSLLARMIHECALRKLRKAEVVWSPTRNHDYLAVMRKIRDDIGVEYFSKFSDLANFFYDRDYERHYNLKVNIEAGAGMNVATDAQFGNAQVGNIAGVIIKDSNIVIPRDDLAVPEEERMARLTDQFLQDLAGALEDGEVVVFFDAIEKMTEKTEAWVWGELLDAVAKGTLGNIRFVLCGQKPPEIGDWLWMVETAELGPLGPEHIAEYLKKRGVDEASRGALADLLWVTTKGNANEIAQHVEAFLALQKKHT